MCQTTVERLLDRMWTRQIRRGASLFAQAINCRTEPDIQVMRGIDLCEGRPELLIDSIPVRYSRLPDKLYFLHEYDTCCRHDNLTDLARTNLGDRLRPIIRDGRTLKTVIREIEQERKRCTFWIAATNGSATTNGSCTDAAVSAYDLVSSRLPTPYKVCLPRGGRL